ncbi:MAG: hypothetical protein LBC63_06315 [Holophagales bacterium]|nr:hypothetical protein [Holophagales bacterium]
MGSTNKRIELIMYVHVHHVPVPPKPPKLPNDWPFQLRKEGSANRKLESVKGASLPGFDGKWRLFSVEDISGAGGGMSLNTPFGRGGLIQAGSYIFRPYRRGGLMARINSGTYSSPLRFEFEFVVHEALWNAGFPTVEPIGYAYRRHYLGYKGVFITRAADAHPWPLHWGRSGSGGHIVQVAALIKALASWGLWAPDLNAGNFIVGANGQMLALDWDKAMWTIKWRLLKRYWARLRRSLIKLDAPQPMIEEIRHVLMDNGL